MTLTELLGQKRLLILDGAMGTELHRQGVDTGLPLWSANALGQAPHVVRNIHYFYLHAGADILTTNTFRTNLRTLRRRGMEDRWEELNLKAVEFAFEARDRYRSDRPVLIAAGLAPVEDCYSPELVPSGQQLREEHGRQAELLAHAGADFFLIETMLDIREAVIAAQACADTSKQFAVSFVTDNSSKLLSGETLSDAVSAVEALSPAALLVNCVSARHIVHVFEMLKSAATVPVGAYANTGTPEPGEQASLNVESDPEHFLSETEKLVTAGAALVGGCCGTTPDYIRAIARRFSPAAVTEDDALLEKVKTAATQ